ncbi:MAG: tetratricopeptide repeat protein, partial [Burkholderiales bacterium]
MGTGAALAQNSSEAAEVQRLLRAGQLEQALQRADTFLASKPRDAQMRFLKGLILTEQKKTQDAINVFQKLSEDFPELPEPHNNLAVLYAAQGQYDKARASLELAIRTDPRYATAYENLGDVYAKLASQAYDRALQLDNSNNLASSKLSLIKDMIGGTQAQLPTRTPVATGTTAPSRP